MTTSSETPAHVTSTDHRRLCDLLLQVAGRDTNRLPSVRRHAAVLAAAIPFMNMDQASVARQRIRRFETKWGPVLPGDLKVTDIEEVSAEFRVAKWLSVRHNPEAHLRVLYRSACLVWKGSKTLLDVEEYAYTSEFDRTLTPVGYDSFKEWMIQLRIADCRHGGSFSPGSLCQWWVEQMAPTTRNDTSYAACLTELETLKSKSRP